MRDPRFLQVVPRGDQVEASIAYVGLKGEPVDFILMEPAVAIRYATMLLVAAQRVQGVRL